MGKLSPISGQAVGSGHTPGLTVNSESLQEENRGGWTPDFIPEASGYNFFGCNPVRVHLTF